jgi:hypothetical protein
MQTAVDKVDAVVQARGGIQCQGRVDKLRCFNMLVRVVQGNCAAPQKLPLGEDTSRQPGGGHPMS